MRSQTRCCRPKCGALCRGRFSNTPCCAEYMAFPLAPHLHHQYLGQHPHSNNMPLLQAVTQMNQSQSGLEAMQHASSLDFVAQHGPVDPHQHLQDPETSDHLPRRRIRKREEPDVTKQVTTPVLANESPVLTTCLSCRPKKRQRSKKPVDAPTRPKSAYMFFLGEFREQYKVMMLHNLCNLEHCGSSVCPGR